MRIVITDAPGLDPVIIEGMTSILLAASDDNEDGCRPCIAAGDPEEIAQCAAVILNSVLRQLGRDTFEAVVSLARRSTAEVRDVTSQTRRTAP